MATHIMTNRNPISGALIFIMLAIIGGLALVAVQSTVSERSHASTKHGSLLATHARQCNQNGDIFQVWKSPNRGTLAELCELNELAAWDDEKTWTIRIIDKITGEEITVFSHSGGVASLEEYMIRQLYFILH